MNTIRIKRKVKSTLLKIKELEKFKGKNIELEIKIKETKATETRQKMKDFAGVFSNYANIDLIDEEKSAWTLAIKEKPENYRR